MDLKNENSTNHFRTYPHGAPYLRSYRCISHLERNYSEKYLMTYVLNISLFHFPGPISVNHLVSVLFTPPLSFNPNATN